MMMNKNGLIDENNPLAVSGSIAQAIPDFPTALDLLASYGNFADVAPGDFVTRVETSNGQVITALSGGPLQVGESRITLDVPVHQPCALEIEASMIRARQQFATIALYEDEGDPDPVPAPINILTISQSSAVQGAAYGAAGTNVTLTLETALPEPGQPGAVFLSDWINITGLVDSRLNYQNACINWISADRKTICFGFSDEAALPSLAIPVVTPTLGTAQVNFYNNMGGAHHGFGFRFTGTTVTSAALLSIFGGGDVQTSGTLVGDHRVSVGSSAPIYNAGTMGNVEIRATTRYRLEGRPSECAFSDKAGDNLSIAFTPRAARTSVKPSLQSSLRARFRLYQPIGMTRPTDTITAISKAGSTTATVTHSGTRTYQVSEIVGIYGVRDITNFAQTVGAITAILSPTQFQMVLGSSVTAASYGGSVCVINGGAAQPGIIGQNIQTVNQYVGNTDWLVVVANGNWSGLNIGDYINLHGVCDAAGVDLALDGAWEVANIATTTAILKPITDIFGQRVTPVTPAIGTVAVNAGGSVILRTTLRSHDLMLEEWSEKKVMIDGQGTGRYDKAMPVQVMNPVPAPATLTVSGSVAADAAVPNPVGVGGRAANVNPAAMSATGDLVNTLMTMLGAIVQKPYAIPEAAWNASAALTTTTATALAAAAGAGIKRHITALQAINTGAAAVDLILLDGATERWRMSLPINVPVAIPFPTEILTTANAALNANLSATGTVRVNAQGYTAP